MCFVVADSAQAGSYTVMLPSPTQLQNVYNNAKTKVATYVDNNPNAQSFVNSAIEKYNNFINQNPQLPTDIATTKDTIVSLYESAPTSFTVTI